MSTVFTNESQDRFFLLPDDAELPVGALVLRSLRGATREVDPDAAAPFEVDEAAAKQAVKAEITDFTKRAAGAITAVGDVLRAAASNKVPKPVEGTTDPRDVLSDTLGIDTDELRNDPKAVKAGLGALLEGLSNTLNDAVSEAPASREATRARIAAMAEAIGATVPDDDAIQASLGKLTDALSDPALAQKVKVASDRLAAATDELKRQRDRIHGELDGLDDDNLPS